MKLKFAKDKKGNVWQMIRQGNKIRIDLIKLDKKILSEMSAEQLVNNL